MKTEEGYSADIYPWRYMSAQCPYYVRTTSHEGYMSHEGDVVRKLCGHISPGIYVRTISFFGFQLRYDEKRDFSDNIYGIFDYL